MWSRGCVLLHLLSLLNLLMLQLRLVLITIVLWILLLDIESLDFRRIFQESLCHGLWNALVVILLLQLLILLILLHEHVGSLLLTDFTLSIGISWVSSDLVLRVHFLQSTGGGHTLNFLIIQHDCLPWFLYYIIIVIIFIEGAHTQLLIIVIVVLGLLLLFNWRFLLLLLLRQLIITFVLLWVILIIIQLLLLLLLNWCLLLLNHWIDYLNLEFFYMCTILLILITSLIVL